MSEEKKEPLEVNATVPIKKKPFYKRWWFIAICAVVVIAAIASAGGGNKESSDTSKSEGTAKQASTEAEKPKKNTVKVGEPLQVGEVKWTATNPEKKAEIPPDNEFSKAAKANGVFVIVNLTAELTGKDSGTIDSSQLAIVDSKGRSFKSTDDFEAYSNLGSDVSIFLKQVNPNVPVKGKAIFDIAADATGLKLQIKDLRFASDEKGFVDLGI